MINILQQFCKALVATMTAYRQKTAVQEQDLSYLEEQLKAMTAERDMLVAEQEEAMKFIDEMTKELDKK